MAKARRPKKYANFAKKKSTRGHISARSVNGISLICETFIPIDAPRGIIAGALLGYLLENQTGNDQAADKSDQAYQVADYHITDNGQPLRVGYQLVHVEDKA